MRPTSRMLSLLLLAVGCAACTTASPPAASVPVPTSAPVATLAATAPPPPTNVPIIAAGVHVGSVDVGGLTLDAARTKLASQASQMLHAIDVQAGVAHTTLDPDEIGLALDIDSSLTAAQQASANANIAPSVHYDAAKLHDALDAFSHDATTPSSIAVLTDTETISRSFVLTPGQKLDVDAAAKQIAERIATPGSTSPVSLTLAPDTASIVHPPVEQLQQQFQAMADEWNGIVGIYAYDLDKHQPIATLNQDTVFSGASVMKVPILLHTYIKSNPLSTAEDIWAHKMIIESDNFSANNLLAASIGGSGTDDALTGVQDMTAMLKDLGLEHTYQNMPYEAGDYLINVRKLKIPQGPPHEGTPPFTEPDPVVRTTPAEMSEIFLWLDDCSKGIGLLLQKFPDQLTPQRCQEMINLLQQNDDHTRLVAGLPPGTTVFHKSGWIEDMQSDVGIVHSAGGNYLVGIYLYRQIIHGKNYLADEIAAPVIADFSRLLYSYYNPTVLGAQPQAASVTTPTATLEPTTTAPTAAVQQATAAAQNSGTDLTPTANP